jgi:hypothetical protein
MNLSLTNNLCLSLRSLTLHLNKILDKFSSSYQPRNRSRQNKLRNYNNRSHKHISKSFKRRNRLKRRNLSRHRNHKQHHNHRLRVRLVLRSTMTL